MLKADIESSGAPVFRIHIEPPKQLLAAEQLGFLRIALARNPGSMSVRAGVAQSLFELGAFAEAIETMAEQVDVAGPQMLLMLGEAQLALETDDNTRSCLGLARRTIERARDDIDRSAALSLQGKAAARLGDVDGARQAFIAALELQPGSSDALKRLANLELKEGRPDRVLELAERAVADGFGYARALSSMAFALVRLGRVDDARRIIGLDRFLKMLDLPPPPGFSSIADFNRALAVELNDHPAVVLDRYGTASRETWRIEQPAIARADLMQRLQKKIVEEVTLHVENLPTTGHPWLDARPARGVFHNWCVMTDADGYETWHMHQNGWLSGVYYVDVPDGVVHGSELAGCLEFGLPTDTPAMAATLEEQAAFGAIAVRPHGGLLMLFPSHVPHRTFPHGCAERRICIAFDIQPE